MPSSNTWIRGLCRQTEAFSRRVARSSLREHPDYPQQLELLFSDRGVALDEWSQAVVCARAATMLLNESGRGQVTAIARGTCGPLLAAVLDAAEQLEMPGGVPAGTDPAFLYELFLSSYRSELKAQRGVYYTPQPLARFVVNQLQEVLCRDFALADGLAATTSWNEIGSTGDVAASRGAAGSEAFVRILDPSLGSGVFLVEVIRSIYVTLAARWQREGNSEDAVRELWNEYVPGCLLPRLAGIELSLPALAVAQLNLAAALHETGFTCSAARPVRLQLGLGDTLAGPAEASGSGTRVAGDEIESGRWLAHRWGATVILGNPPFSGISSNRGDWIRGLLRGDDRSGAPAASYYQVDGKPLGERKLWLQDDYVKFFRYAQWRIERSGAGAIGLVTNHGYLDNATFRGMRAALLETFTTAIVVDLHGNRKKDEVPPESKVDENIFSIAQGTAVGVFSRALTGRPVSVRRGDLWGTRADKLARLQRGDVSLQVLEPRPPQYWLTAAGSAGAEPLYTAGISLPQAMPINSTAVVTARDRLVIGMNDDELRARLRQFCDLRVDDEVIRERFASTRSTRYLPGDSRSWRLADARRRLAESKNWENEIRPCLYRPFDERAILWLDWMVDWPRAEVSRHLLRGDNLALVARRQMLPTQPCSYFWVTRHIAIDGVIRSDNRGSESVFPLYLDKGAGHGRTANLAPALVEALSGRLGWHWLPEGCGDLVGTFGPEDVLHYIYALFHASSYRERFAHQLRVDFPRVLLTGHGGLWRSLCAAGQRLVQLHLLAGGSESPADTDFRGPLPAALLPGFPRHAGDQLWLSDDCWLDGVPPQVWHYRVGGYQVCRKWLRDRRQLTMSHEQWQHYRRIVSSLAETLSWMEGIDQQIEDAGGWQGAFAEVDSDGRRKGGI